MCYHYLLLKKKKKDKKTNNSQQNTTQKTKIEQNQSHETWRGNSSASKGYSFPGTLLTPVVVKIQ